MFYLNEITMGKHLLFTILFVINTCAVLANCGSNPDLIIPQNNPNGATDALNVGDTPGVLGDSLILEEVCVFIEHALIGYVDIILTSPDGTEITLCEFGDIQEHADTDNFGTSFIYEIEDEGIQEDIIEMCFSMNAVNSIEDYYGTGIGEWLPSEGFEDFDGEGAEGDWVLQVVDHVDTTQFDYDVGEGTFVSWSVGFSEGPCVATVGIDSFILKNVPVWFEGLSDIYCSNQDSFILEGFPAPLESIMDTQVVSTDGFNITENGESFSTITIDEFINEEILISINNISVTVELEHDWIGDLSIGLVAPCGQTIVLIDQPGYPDIYNFSGSWSDVDGAYTFTDTAAVAFPQTQAFDVIPSGLYLPEQSFAELLGCKLNGEWSLIVIDHVEGDDGVFVNWTLNLAYTVDQSSTSGIFSGPGITDHGDSLSTATFNPANANMGVNEITYDFTYLNGTVYSYTEEVNINGAPMLATIDSVNICDLAGYTLNLEDYNPTVSNPGLLGGGYTWYADSALTQIIDSPIIDDYGTYYVEYVSLDTGCSAVAEFKVGGDPHPEVELSNTGPYCVGDTVVLSSMVTTPSDNVYYEWIGPDGFYSQYPNDTILPEHFVEGIYTLQLTIDGCLSDTFAMEIAFYDLPAPQFELIENSIDTVCINDTIVTYTLEGEIFDQYVWNVVDGIVLEGGGANDNTITIDWNAEVTGQLWAEIEDADYECTFYSDTLTVNYFNVPSLSFVIAVNEACALQDTTIYTLFNTSSFIDYAWTVHNGTIVDSASNSSSISVVWDDADSTSVLIEAVNFSNCTNSLFIDVNAVAVPTPEFVEEITAVCAGTIETYTLDTTYLYQDWDITGGTKVDGGAGVDNYVSIIWDEVNIGTINIEVITPQGCIDSLVQEITIHALPDAEFVDSTNMLCYGDTITYTLTEAYSGYTWETDTNFEVLDGGGNNDFVTVTSSATTPTQGLISVVVENNNMCTDSIAVLVDILSLPEVDLVNPLTVVCTGDSVTYTANSSEFLEYSWMVENGDTVLLHDTMIAVLWGSSPMGNVVLMVTDINGCTNIIDYDVIINPLPNPELIDVIETVCLNTEATYTLNQIYDNYVWDVSGYDEIIAGGGENDDFITVVWNDVDSSAFMVIVSANGCSGTLTETIDFHQTENPVFESYEETACLSGDIIVYTVEDDFENYDWQVENGTIVTGGNINENFAGILWTGIDTGTIVINVTDGNTCTSSSEIDIVLLELPSIAISNSTIEACAGDTIIYTASVDSFDTYIWSITNGTIIENDETTVTVIWDNNVSSGSLTLEIENAEGCSNTTTTTVDINGQPTPTILTEILPICVGIEETYTLTQVYDTYDWDIVGGTPNGTIDNNYITITWDDTTVHEINVTVTSNGCTGFLSQDITVNDLPEPSFEVYTDTLCNYEDTITYTLTETYESYTWNVSSNGTKVGGGTNADNFVDVVWSNSGTLSTTVFDENGCEATTIATITILDLPQIDINNPTLNICVNDTVIYTANDNDYQSYQWIVQGGTIVSANDIPSIEVVWNMAGVETITLIVTDSLGCDNATTYDVIITETPTPTFANPIDNICQFASGIEYTLDDIYTEHEFVVVGGTITSPIDPTSNSITVDWGNAEDASITATVTNAAGCTDSTVLEITIEQPDAPDFEISTLEVCSEDDSVLYALPAGTDFATYEWYYENGEIAAGGGINDTSILINWNEANGTNGFIAVTMTDASGCYYLTDTLEVIINPLPTPVFAESTDTVCAFQSGVIYALDEVYEVHSWEIDGGVIIENGDTIANELAIGNSVIVNWGASATGQVEVTVTDEKGCQQIMVVPVVISPVLDPTFENPITAVCEASSVVTYTLDTTYAVYDWTTNGNEISGGNGENTITVDWAGIQNGELAVTVTSAGGCTETKTLAITIDAEFLPEIADIDTTICGTDSLITYTLTETYTNYIWTVNSGDKVEGGTATDNYVVVDWNDGISNGSIHIEVSDDNNCSGENTVDFTIYPATDINIQGLQENVCLGEEITYSLDNAFTDYSWTINGGTIVGANNTATLAVMWDTLGAGNIAISTVDANGCNNDLVQIINVIEIPNPLFEAYDTVVCGTSNTITYTLTESYETYLWAANGGNIVGEATNAGVTVQWNTMGTGTLTVMVTNAADCEGVISNDIEILEPINISLSDTGNLDLCGGSEETYSLSNSFAEYDWMIQGGTVEGSTQDSTITVIWSGTTSGLIEVSVVDTNGCTANLVQTVNVQPGVEAFVTPIYPAICVGSAVTLTVGGVENSDVTIEWFDDNDVNVGNDIALTISPNTTTMYTAYVTANTGGCQDTIAVSVTVLDELTVEPILSTSAVCVGDSEGVNLVPSGAINYEVFATTEPNNNLTANADGSYTLVPTAPTNYTLIGTSGTCADTTTFDVQVMMPPQIDWQESIVIGTCVGASTPLDPQITTTGNYTFSWNTDTGLSDTTIINPMASPTTETTYTLTITNDGGCETSASVTITPLPMDVNVSVGDTLSICSGSSAEVILSGAIQYNWTPADNVTAVNDSTFEISTIGNQEYTITGTDGFGCEETAALFVQETGTIQATVSDNAIICGGGETQLLATGGATYSWSPAESVSDPNIANPMAFPTETTTYEVTVSQGADCSDVLEVTVEVTAGITVEAGIDGLICPEESFVITDATAENYTNLQWTANAAGIFSDATILNPTFTPDASVTTENIELTLTATNDQGCTEATDIIFLQIADVPPTITLLDDMIEVCEGEMIDLQALVDATQFDAIWSGGNGSFTNSTLLETGYQTLVGETGMFDLELTISNACYETTTSVNVIVNPSIALDIAGGDQITVQQGENVSLEAFGDPNSDYSWSAASNTVSFSCLDCKNPVLTLQESTTINVSSNSGCSDGASIYVIVEKTSIMIPNAFSPNQDGVNDYFHPLGTGYELESFQVFNRYGQIVYQTIDGDAQGWDGTFKGVEQETGVYSFVCIYTVDGTIKQEKGNVTLIR